MLYSLVISLIGATAAARCLLLKQSNEHGWQRRRVACAPVIADLQFCFLPAEPALQLDDIARAVASRRGKRRLVPVKGDSSLSPYNATPGKNKFILRSRTLSFHLQPVIRVKTYGYARVICVRGKIRSPTPGYTFLSILKHITRTLPRNASRVMEEFDFSTQATTFMKG